MLIYAYDYEAYERERGFYYDFKEITPGPIIYNAEDLLESIKNIDRIDLEYREKRKELNERFNHYRDGKSIERILKHFNIKYK